MRRSIQVPRDFAGDPTSGWELRPQAELVQYIEHHYHAGLRRDLPMLVALARHVERDQADHPDVPAGVADLLADFAAELDGHMVKEETVVFPTLRCSTRRDELAMPIRLMERDHDGHADWLERIREVTRYLQTPADASLIWKALYAGLAALEVELREHIYLEDGVLFERAISGR